MPDYIPDSDAEFNDWQGNFMDYLNNNAGNIAILFEMCPKA
jgi:hypothetical protein